VLLEPALAILPVATAPRALRQPLSLVARLDIPRRVTLVAAGLVVVLVAMLLAFIGWNGTQIFTASGASLADVFGPSWSPSSTPAVFGILPFVLGTLGVMIVAAVIAAPLSIGLAVFMAEVAPPWARSVTRPAMEVFVGIPSVVYGFLGLTVLVPFLRQNLSGLGFTLGFSWFAGSLVLALMILPTIASFADDPGGSAVGVDGPRDDALADDPPHPPADCPGRSPDGDHSRHDAGRRRGTCSPDGHRQPADHPDEPDRAHDHSHQPDHPGHGQHRGR